eukprot:14414-Heterococcus_DN1.PRE.8
MRAREYCNSTQYGVMICRGAAVPASYYCSHRFIGLYHHNLLAGTDVHANGFVKSVASTIVTHLGRTRV